MGAIEFQEGVESLDVHVPLFAKEEDDDKKKLQLEAVDVPLGIADIAKRFVNITIIKDHGEHSEITRICNREFIFTSTRLCIFPSSFPASSIFSFLQPAYTYSRQDGLVNIPVNREIIEDGRTQVTYRTRDLTAKDKLVSSYSGISLYPTKNVWPFTSHYHNPWRS